MLDSFYQAGISTIVCDIDVVLADKSLYKNHKYKTQIVKFNDNMEMAREKLKKNINFKNNIFGTKQNMLDTYTTFI